MNTSMNQPFLSEDEVLFHRMETFHRQRVDVIAAGRLPPGKGTGGILVVHLLHASAFKTRKRFDGTQLKEHGAKLSRSYYTSRFNVDGLLCLDSEQAGGAYSQFFRDGCLEAFLAPITFQANSRNNQDDQQPRYLNDSKCESDVIDLVSGYSAFCEGVGVAEPVMLFSALIACKGATYYSQWGSRFGEIGIDRDVVCLPEIEVDVSHGELEAQLLPWCDILAQTLGREKSSSYDNDGKRQNRRDSR